jgi:hypothetical protein
MYRFILPLVATFALAAPAAAVTLSTPLTAGNGQSGIMFDIVAGANALTITGGAVSLDSGAWTIEIYTRPGTMVGNLGSAGWTLLSSLSGVSGGGDGSQTLIDFADFGMAAGSTTGLYITGTVGGTSIVNYTNGTSVGGVVASDANLSILSGYGRSYAFGADFSPRNFNGSLTYILGEGGGGSPGVPEPAGWAMLIAGFGLTGASARRRRALRRTAVTA